MNDEIVSGNWEVVGRNEKGQFAKGVSRAAGPGRYHISDLRKALASAVTTEDVYQVMTVLVKKAKTGDVDAIRLLFDRLFGKLPQMKLQLEETTQTINVQVQKLSDLSNEELDTVNRVLLQLQPEENAAQSEQHPSS